MERTLSRFCYSTTYLVYYVLQTGLGRIKKFSKELTSNPRLQRTGMILFKDRVAADFLVRSKEFPNIGLGWSWDFLVGTVWLHLFLCLYEYILTGK